MKKIKTIALLMTMLMAVSAFGGCGSSDKDDGKKQTTVVKSNVKSESTDIKKLPAGSIDLTVMLPLGQWTDNFDVLVDSYKADHPEKVAAKALKII